MKATNALKRLWRSCSRRQISLPSPTQQLSCPILRRQLSRPLFTASAVSRGKVETLSACPDPACACADMPPDLDIDRSSPLGGTMVTYDEHLVIRTGVSDWTSRIEDDERFPFVKMLKQRLGRGGKFHDPFTNVMLTTSSGSPNNYKNTPSLLLFPSFRSITSTTATSQPLSLSNNPATLDAIIRAHLLPETPTQPPKAQFASSANPTGTDTDNADTPSEQQQQQLRDPSAAAEASLETHDITHLTVLICGHNARDSRCGILGPVLKAQFADVLARKGFTLGPSHANAAGSESSSTGSNDVGDESNSATIEAISHIGGHKFAGNVILYIPRVGPRWVGHPLAGKGIWYGRVEPRHVEGIVDVTVGRGVVIEELFRGGIGPGKEMLRL